MVEKHTYANIGSETILYPDLKPCINVINQSDITGTSQVVRLTDM